MEAENDVANQIVNHAHKEKPINVKDMEAENGVMNRIVKQVHEKIQINVSHMEAENDVQIVKIGPIREVDV